MLSRKHIGSALMLMFGACWTAGAGAQVRLDRADPTITERSLAQPDGRPMDSERVTVTPPIMDPLAATASSRPIGAVVVRGADPVPAAAFAPVIAPRVGRQLSRKELSDLAGAIASIARVRGFPFATAMIGAQPMDDGILTVTVDLGRIDAVRVIGATNTAADALLVRTLVNHGPVRQADLERALLLVGDVPGVRVKETRFVRQDSFGILLVTIVKDRVSAYVQLDNRGTREVGPFRSTVLGSLRGLVSDGDELGVILAQTPVNISEFNFLRSRYAAPIDRSGSILAVSASFGRSNPGASLKPLDVVGHSGDVAVSLSRPLVRRRDRSIWGGVEFRAVSIQQFLSGRKLRDDRLATLTASLNGLARFAGGSLRGEIGGVAGLPLSGVTHEGDALTSRVDGDARFVAGTFSVEWVRPLFDRFSIVAASAGQIASRPLLATAEIGVGGPVFGRGYDYAERTGDTGIMGSMELRADAGWLVRGVADRAHLYAFADGGTVSNLRQGFGGGTLVSAGAGIRAGRGLLDGMIELAFPINEDRFDTRSKRPRLSLRLSRAF